MKLKIATWNMAHWSHKNYGEEAWDYFLNQLADIFLFQESARPRLLNDDPNFLWHPAGLSANRSSWGTGIYSQKFKLTEEPEESIPEWSRDRFKELCVIGNAKIGGQNLTLISLYGRMDKIGNIVYSIPNLHRVFSDLTGILNGHFGKRQIVLGGDLNASLQIDQQQPGNAHKILFDRVADFGLNDCFQMNGNDDFVQTLRHPRSTLNWQNDYFFVNGPLVKGFVACEVIDNDQVRRFSDHNPVVITLEI